MAVLTSFTFAVGAAANSCLETLAIILLAFGFFA